MNRDCCNCLYVRQYEDIDMCRLRDDMCPLEYSCLEFRDVKTTWRHIKDLEYQLSYYSTTPPCAYLLKMFDVKHPCHTPSLHDGWKYCMMCKVFKRYKTYLKEQEDNE